VSEYSALDRALHRLALQVKPIAELSFQIDQALSRADATNIVRGRHVFVSGLARAGTTVLMRRLYASGELCSLTYRHMPFVLAPNFWSRFTMSRKGGNAAERAHGDRIMVDIDSPESLDEVFWRIFDGDSYIANDFLAQHDPDEGIVNRYAAYVGAILKSDRAGRARYLSKNNNNVLRLRTLRRIFPMAVILIPFREPVSHASSLLRQHRNFIAYQREDAFVREYMTWLAHHEFGLDHRPFQFDSDGRERLVHLDPDGIDYWLELWCQVYSWVERTAPEDAILVCYEDLCHDHAVWQRLAARCGVPQGGAPLETFAIASSSAEVDADDALTGRASALYERFLQRSRNTG
jgi:hypothetical protein